MQYLLFSFGAKWRVDCFAAAAVWWSVIRWIADAFRFKCTVVIICIINKVWMTKLGVYYGVFVSDMVLRFAPSQQKQWTFNYIYAIKKLFVINSKNRAHLVPSMHRRSYGIVDNIKWQMKTINPWLTRHQPRTSCKILGYIYKGSFLLG